MTTLESNMSLPKVDALGRCPMALHLVPPGHRDEGTGEHDTGDVPVQDLDALVNQTTELPRVRLPGCRSHDGIQFQIGVGIPVVASPGLERVGPLVGDLRNCYAVRVEGQGLASCAP